TFRERLADYPVRIEVLSRFRGTKDTKQVTRQLDSGEVDVVIGTHRLLSRDVTFHDLGLLVVDEEHRFGVRRKERLTARKGEVDVLVSTMIVEYGLDVPNANTMIVNRADQFGLAQLYQLRGRVGRSHRRAYCYLLVPDLVDADAEERLRALEHHTDLGSGYR